MLIVSGCGRPRMLGAGGLYTQAAFADRGLDGQQNVSQDVKSQFRALVKAALQVCIQSEPDLMQVVRGLIQQHQEELQQNQVPPPIAAIRLLHRAQEIGKLSPESACAEKVEQAVVFRQQHAPQQQQQPQGAGI